MLLNRESEAKLKKDGEKMGLFKDNIQRFNRRIYCQTSRQKKRQKKKLHRRHTSFNWLGKKIRNIVKNIKSNETAKNVEC